VTVRTLRDRTALARRSSASPADVEPGCHRGGPSEARRGLRSRRTGVGEVRMKARAMLLAAITQGLLLASAVVVTQSTETLSPQEVKPEAAQAQADAAPAAATLAPAT